MSFDLAVWYSDKPLHLDEAGELYRKLCTQEWLPIEDNVAVEAFYQELCWTYPEIDTLPEDQVEDCPWSCEHDRSGLHVIMCIRHGSKASQTAPYIVDLAKHHGLICYDPQGPDIYLPPNLKVPKRSRFRFW